MTHFVKLALAAACLGHLAAGAAPAPADNHPRLN